MDQFGGAGADGMYAEQLPGVPQEQHLEEAAVVAENLAAGDFAVACDASFIRNAAFRQLMLRGTNHGDFRDRIDPDGKVLRHVASGNAEGMTGGETPLLRGRRRQTGETDHVTRGKDV